MTGTLRISDIASTDVLFYDAQLEAQCYKLCAERDIEYLPSLDEPGLLYVRNDNSRAFITEPLGEDRQVDGAQRAFHPALLAAFRRHHVLLVYTEGQLSGMLHFSDFNKSAVSVYLFELFFQYDRLLRSCLRARLLTNADMLAYFKSKTVDARTLSGRLGYQSKIEDYHKRKSELEGLPPFQSFTLNDLIGLANAHGSDLSSEVSKLRTMIMHQHEAENRAASNAIHSIISFEKFYQRALRLQRDHRKLQNQMVLLQGSIR